jgi:hypothetical protein
LPPVMFRTELVPWLRAWITVTVPLGMLIVPFNWRVFTFT